MKFIISILLFFLIVSTSDVFAQCDSIKALSPFEFSDILKQNANVVLVDVRTKKEFKKGHINGALLAKNSKELYHIIDLMGKSKVYLLYCKDGDRSIDAGKMIYDKYQISIYFLDGGLDFWLESGFGL